MISQTISFEAETYDPEDGVLPDGSLQWSSSIDGAIGTGALLQIDTLSIGTHTITLDGDGQRQRADDAELHRQRHG